MHSEYELFYQLNSYEEFKDLQRKISLINKKVTFNSKKNTTFTTCASKQPLFGKIYQLYANIYDTKNSKRQILLF